MIRVPLESNSTKYQTKEKYDETEKIRLGAKKLKEFDIRATTEGKTVRRKHNESKNTIRSPVAITTSE